MAGSGRASLGVARRGRHGRREPAVEWAGIAAVCAIVFSVAALLLSVYSYVLSRRARRRLNDEAIKQAIKHVDRQLNEGPP
jgi:ABC-type Fe3+ transport system permease subunit